MKGMISAVFAGTLAILVWTLVTPAPAQMDMIQADSRRDCAVCHLQWVDAFDQPQAPLLIDRPSDPVAADADTCLGCHDGSLADSRDKVWLEHGHRTGITPPETMTVPDYLPLVDGKVVCRTCHSAHGDAETENMANAVFLRVPNENSELCMACHADKTKGPELGTHPVGGMPWEVPAELIAAGAKVGPDRFRLTCQTCHAAHGAHEDKLLVMGTQSSQLCLTCHKKLRPGMWLPEVGREHPQNPPLVSQAQFDAIEQMGTQLGPGNTLMCLSCHKLHHGQSGRDMLADTLEGSKLCLRCHPERKSVLASGHDLRTSAPEERNRRGFTPEQSGPCGACHSFHEFARRPDPQPGDPTGLCLTCHAEGRVAYEAGKGPKLSHPGEIDPAKLPEGLKLSVFNVADDPSAKSLACLTCHDPHEQQATHFLRAKPDQLCSQCHPQPFETLAGGHDFATQQPDLTNAKGRPASETGRCGFCHGVHNALGPVMWVATENPPSDPDGLCTVCHEPGGLGEAKPLPALGHPTGLDTLRTDGDPTNMPLYDQTIRQSSHGEVACGSCHDAHGDPSCNPGLLRETENKSKLCAACHATPAHLVGGLHDCEVKPTVWPVQPSDDDGPCFACHQAHTDDPSETLWTVPSPQNYEDSPDGLCLACHQHTEWASHEATLSPGRTIHPKPMTDLTSQSHGLPMVPEAGGHVPDTIGCRTCHNPHAPPDGPAHLLRTGVAQDPATMCLRCHESVQYIGMSMHSQEALAAHPGETQACGPCHVVHAEPGSSAAKMWAGPAGSDMLPPDVRRCLGCHASTGEAKKIALAPHPMIVMGNMSDPGTSGFMPLADEQGGMARSGRIGCFTCHMTHGRPPSESMAAIDPTAVDPSQLRAMMPMLRPFTAPNLCTSCHGYDGLRRFLYYHDPAKRRGAMELPRSANESFPG